MPTTIQVSDTTKQRLESLKKKEKASSYDKLIDHLMRKHTHTPKSMFGVFKDTKWKKEYRMDFDER